MPYTIPKNALVAVPDFKNFSNFKPSSFKIVEPEDAFIPAFDRSYHFGDSVYEVVRTYQGILYTYEEHMQRLKASMTLGAYATLPDFELIEQMVDKTTRAFYSKFGNCNVYIRTTVSRGFGDLNIDPRTSSEPYAVVFVKKLEDYPKKMFEEGVEFAIVDRRRNSPRALEPMMKSGNYLNNVLAIAESNASSAYDALMLSNEGFVTEGTTNNVFIVKDGKVLTPPVSVGILEGITRNTLRTLARTIGIEIEERLFTEKDFLEADEAFFTSTTKEIVPITKVNRSPIGSGSVGPKTKALMELFQAHIKKFIKENEGKSLYV